MFKVLSFIFSTSILLIQTQIAEAKTRIDMYWTSTEYRIEPQPQKIDSKHHDYLILDGDKFYTSTASGLLGGTGNGSNGKPGGEYNMRVSVSGSSINMMVRFSGTVLNYKIRGGKSNLCDFSISYNHIPGQKYIVSTTVGDGHDIVDAKMIGSDFNCTIIKEP